MSGSSFDQPPAFFSLADYRDTDTFALDCTANMLARNNQIASVGAAVITRTDGTTVGTGDYTVTNIQVLPVGAVVPTPSGQSTQVTYPGTWFSWTGSGGVDGIGYNLTFPITLVKNNVVIYRTVQINTSSNVG